MTDLAKGLLKRGERMDEGIIAYMLHEALMVSHVPPTVGAVRSTFAHLRATSCGVV